MCEKCKKANDIFADALEEKFLKREEMCFKEAVKLAMQKGYVNVVLLQSKLEIGYSRAARIIDQMEAHEYIEPSNGKAKRKVIITPKQFKEDFGEEYNS